MRTVAANLALCVAGHGRGNIRGRGLGHDAHLVQGGIAGNFLLNDGGHAARGVTAGDGSVKVHGCSCNTDEL